MLFTQNEKLKKSSTNSHVFFAFGIPAIKTCPFADKCKAGCYATQGCYQFFSTKNAQENRLELTKNEELFINTVNADLIKLRKKGKKVVLRIHDSGDFYSKDYLATWLKIIDQNTDVVFYAYSKSVKFFIGVKKRKNFRVIFSYGGKLDNMILPNKHYNARVFASREELLSNGYVDSSDNDSIAALGENNKIGLIYHGTKKIENTKWSEV